MTLKSDESKNHNRKLNYYAVIVILLVIAIPVAYSATQPSVIINMINGQTEKPIIVKDNLGAVVFSIDVDGTIFPEIVVPVPEVPVGNPIPIVEDFNFLRYNNTGKVTVPSSFNEGANDGGVDDTFQILAQWTITNEGSGSGLIGDAGTLSNFNQKYPFFTEGRFSADGFREGTSNNSNSGGKATECRLIFGGYYSDFDTGSSEEDTETFWYLLDQGGTDLFFVGQSSTTYVLDDSELYAQTTSVWNDDTQGQFPSGSLGSGQVQNEWDELIIWVITYHEIVSNNSPHESIVDDGKDCVWRDIDMWITTDYFNTVSVVRDI